MEQKNGHEEQVNGNGHSQWDSVDFRHLNAFQRVYQNRNYAHAGLDMFGTRKSVVRMMRNLERSFECELFKEGAHGELTPSVFAERLHHDLRFLNTARQRMEDHIAAVYENGRVLRVGCSAAVFRTREFRHLFRGLQSQEGIRTRYSPINLADAGKALSSGKCDVYIGGWTGTDNRFTSRVVGDIAFRLYERKSDGAAAASENDTTPNSYVVVLDSEILSAGAPRSETSQWLLLEEAWWLSWLDHPEECPPGTRILGPDVQLDPEYWEPREEMTKIIKQPLAVSFLNHHPYSFLPTLVGSIQPRSVNG